MLFERKDLPELHYIKHLHDDEADFINYEKMILDRTLSPHIFENKIMSGWLTRMQPLVSMLFDQMNVIKNFRNFMVDKYYYKHKR